MDLGAHQRGPEPLRAAPSRSSPRHCAFKIRGSTSSPVQGPLCRLSGSWLALCSPRPGCLHADSGRAPVGCPLIPVGGMMGGAALGRAIGHSAHGHPPFLETHGNGCRSAQTGTLVVVAEVAEEVVGRPRSTTFTSGSLLPPVGVGHPPAWCLCQGDPARAVSPARNPHSPAGWGP